jgi:uncharacterized repeat protein (TIGR03803 family)
VNLDVKIVLKTENGTKPFIPFLVIMTSLALLGCGGSGGGITITPPPVTYTIGGAVSFLLGTGLVLQDNGGNNLSISENGLFTFNASVLSGGTYSVTVLTQPSSPAQTCVVANGSGTANTYISNVQVVCSTYTIGGTVSGLAGTPLLLQDNGGDNLGIDANGSFTFATPIATGGNYNVTVFVQPYNQAQTCVVANGSGTANANVTTVQVTCTSNEQVLHSFANVPDGNNPLADLVLDSSGNLYGTTFQGGTLGYGTVFKLTPSNGQWTETVLYSFCQQGRYCADGASPHSGLILDTAGNLYGTTLQGGIYGDTGGPAIGDGVVFELSPQPDGTWTETVLHSFGNGTDGIGPFAGLVFDNAGNLYGTTSGGGTGTNGPDCPASFGGCGTVFELSPGPGGQWTEKVLYNFCSQTDCADGYDPLDALILDTAGNLYGTTVNGGTPSPSGGTVFELTPGENEQWVETVLYAFQDPTTDGNNPHGSLVQDKAGDLYGTTSYGYSVDGGAAFGNGIVFELTHESEGPWPENILHAFCSYSNCADGSASYAGLVFDKAGNLYGTTFNAGLFGCGVVFELIPGKNGTWTEEALYGFDCGKDGGNPENGVILDAAGNVYGVAGGGTYGYGVVFELTP